MAEVSINVTMFDGSQDNPALEHKFVATAKTAPLEYGFLEKIKQMVEQQYSGGVPPHRRPSARDQNIQENQSMIFIVEYDEFKDMTAQEIQEIFRHRSILVRNWPEKTVKFDRDGLSELGPLHKPSSFQGKLTKSF
jgi:hypothetical protein